MSDRQHQQTFEMLLGQYMTGGISLDALWENFDDQIIEPRLMERRKNLLNVLAAVLFQEGGQYPIRRNTLRTLPSDYEIIRIDAPGEDDYITLQLNELPKNNLPKA